MAHVVWLDQPICQRRIDAGHVMVHYIIIFINFHSLQPNYLFVYWSITAQSFPTPMEEPKKVLKAQYLGSTEVQQPTGMEVLNAAIESALNDGKSDQWESVNVAVAPSMISIHSSEVNSALIEMHEMDNNNDNNWIEFRLQDNDRLIAECRVRYLSFLGIGKNVKNCAFIMHTAQDKFICHIFLCEPSSGALCKTIEAACKVWIVLHLLFIDCILIFKMHFDGTCLQLRYQKCLDAHPESGLSTDSSTPNTGLGATIKNLMNTLSLNKKDRACSWERAKSLQVTHAVNIFPQKKKKEFQIKYLKSFFFC